MLGKKVGDTVKIESPAGEIEYKIVKVKWDLGEKRGQHSYYALVR